MQDVGYVDQNTALAVRSILDKPVEPDSTQDAQFILDYYKSNYDFVQIVKCLSCGSDLCLWVLDRGQVKQNMQNLHPLGLRRIELGDNFRSTRLRHDGSVGYYCSCGADSRISEVEKGYVNQTSTHVPADAPHVKALVKKKILATNYKPDVSEVDGKTITDGLFEHSILKSNS
jgi:hypothetical protein